MQIKCTQRGGCERIEKLFRYTDSSSFDVLKKDGSHVSMKPWRESADKSSTPRHYYGTCQDSILLLSMFRGQTTNWAPQTRLKLINLSKLCKTIKSKIKSALKRDEP